MRPRIGIPPCREAGEGRGETKLYAEETTIVWLRSGGAVPLVLPPPGDGVTADDIVAGLDGLVLHGGAYVAPESYGATALKEAWRGDATRDGYELALVAAALARDLPILGICRGMQLLNVARGGTLWQDLIELRPDSQPHLNGDDLDFVHPIAIEPGALLADWYGTTRGVVDSVHHQGLDRLGAGVVVEARATDGVVEAIRIEGTHAYGVQWHPEYMHGAVGLARHPYGADVRRETPDVAALDPAILLNVFLEKTRWRS